MDSFILIINLKYFHLPIRNNGLAADPKHAFLSLTVKTVPLQTPFWAQPWKHRTIELKVSCVPALASLLLWSVMHPDSSSHLKLSVRTPVLPYRDCHRQMFYKLIWPEVSAGTFQEHNLDEQGWHQLAPECAAAIQWSSLAKEKTLWFLAEQEFHSQVSTFFNKDFEETEKVTLGGPKLRPLRGVGTERRCWHHWDCPGHTQSVSHLGWLVGFSPSEGCEHHVWEESTRSSLAWVLPLVYTFRQICGCKYGHDGEILLLNLSCVIQGWVFVKGLWESGTWVRWQLRGVWYITQLRSPGNASETSPSRVLRRKETI